MPATLAQLNISSGGIPKLPIPEALVSFVGVEGDWQKNRKYHGGPDRAICLYSVELYDWLAQHGISITSGSLGENFTTRGIDLNKLSPRDQLLVGDSCIVEITQVRVPCSTLKKWNADLPELIVGRSGWVARVVREGTVRVGDEIQVLKSKS